MIALRYFEDMADADIAIVMGCSVRDRAQPGLARAALRAVTALERSQEEA